MHMPCFSMHGPVFAARTARALLDNICARIEGTGPVKLQGLSKCVQIFHDISIYEHAQNGSKQNAFGTQPRNPKRIAYDAPR